MHLPGFETGEEIGGGEHRFRRARRVRDGRRVLLKALHEDVRARPRCRALLERELEIGRDLDVPGVLSPLELIDGAVLVLTDAPGVPLSQLLVEAAAPLPLTAALRIAAELAATLSALHQRDLLHRDLRPANVLYDQTSGHVHLTGLGRATRVPREAWGISVPERMVGDPTYLAPEASGRINRQLDYRADLYSLGVILYEMLAGRPPFDHSDPMALVHAHLALEPPDPRALRRVGVPPGSEADLPDAVVAIVGKLLAKAAEERYQSGLGLRHDLERCLEDLETVGEIQTFDPGERDLAERFELPQTLFGREEELRWLEDALSVTVEGHRTMRLVAGYSGVGKTSLIEEIRFSVLRRRGLFASGTFERRSRTMPYQGILAALRVLILQKLGADQEEIDAWSRRLVAKLGDQLGVLAEDLPELLSVVEEPPAVPEVQSENARNRFYVCVERFLATLAPSGQAPLVLFFDDLQWIDPASLRLLESLLLGEEGAFLVLGAYRDNEVGEDHPLSSSVASLAARGVDVDTLRLTPLGEEAIARLVAETLHLPSLETAPLAELIYRKTAGNPFFARSFLSTLYQRRLLRFTALVEGGGASRWTWDLDAIRALEATENVVELVARQLADLPVAIQRTVAAAAVIGKEFEAETLAEVCKEEKEVLDLLFEACRRGLLVNTGERFAFVHDRVREGAYSLLDDAEREAFHLRIGRLLRERERRNVFEAADHLNRATRRITEPAELLGLVELNSEAGRHARSSGAFPAAFDYLGRGLELLHRATDAPWRDHYELCHGLHADAAEAASLAGDDGATERLTETLQRNARNLLDALPAYELRIYRLFSRRDEEGAMHLSLEVLHRLGMEIPLEPEAEDLDAAVTTAEEAVEAVLATVGARGAGALPEMRDPEQLAVARILARTVLFAGWSRVRLLRLAACRLAELTAVHGVGPSSPLAYVLMAEVRCGELGDVVGGRRIGELGLELARHLGARGGEATCRTLFELLVGGRTVHPASLRERFQDHFRRNLEAGDLLAAGACGVQSSIAGLLSGRELAEVVSSAREFDARARSFGQLMMAHSIERVARLAEVLRGRGTVRDAVDMNDVAPGAAQNVRVRVLGPEMMALFFLRQGVEALAVAHESLSLPHGIVPLFPFDFFRCLIFLESDARDGVCGEDLALCRRRLEKQAGAAPALYRHKLDLVRAHEKRFAGLSGEALALYEKAIVGARRHDFPHEEALARELAAELCLELSRPRDAAAYLREALAAYDRWGAAAKVEQLLETYPDLVSAPDEPAKPFDVTSLERAQHVLTGELDLARLLSGLMTLLLQNAGARRGFLLRVEDRRIVIEASGTDGEVDLLDRKLEDCDEIAASVVRYVARTRETVALGDVARDPRFATDSYVERTKTRSILCFPLRQRGRTVEIVYLENDRSPDVFSPERSGAVRLLASHATTALENARLHHSLKQEVETRRRAEADLAALKDRLQAENVYLQEEIQSHFEEIVGDSEAMKKVLYKVEQVAATDATVLILGETGTGKELIARALHRLSGRRERPLVKVNCAALPATLIESELFGHEKGAFTGALSRKIGRFELADAGTLFLDEIGDLPLDLQAKLLRVLQEGEFERLGNVRTQKVDVRIIAATNRDLEHAMAEGTFRPDLYYRLTVFPVDLPPLRERTGDVPLLARYFVARKQAKLGKSIQKIPQGVMDRFNAYRWPGNVRELENVVERALILSPGDTLELEESFGGGKSADTPASDRLEDLERVHIRKVLEACGWKVKGEDNAAERLGLAPPTLRNRMKKLGVERPG